MSKTLYINIYSQISLCISTEFGTIVHFNNIFLFFILFNVFFVEVSVGINIVKIQLQHVQSYVLSPYCAKIEYNRVPHSHAMFAHQKVLIKIRMTNETSGLWWRK